MKKNTFTFFIVLFVIAIQTKGYCEFSVDEIIDRANKVAFYQGADGKALVKMTITDSQGRQRKRVLSILRLDIEDGGDQKFYVYFKKPADVEDMVYMVWKHVDNDDDRWMYLPALDLVRRIAAGDKRASFVGSNYVYEDISGRSLNQDAHELIASDEDTYTIKNVPINPNDVEFSYFTVVIDNKNFMPKRAEYYNKQGKLYRIIEALEVRDVNGHPTVVKSKASDLEIGSSTVIEFSDVGYDIGLDEEIFTERYLRRPPRKWLK
jgi:outer membrane lipoprotein-sorting protein